MEIVDSDGNVVCSIGSDKDLGAALAFFDDQRKKRIELAVQRRMNPSFTIYGPGGMPVVNLELGQKSKPRLFFSDEDFTGRVYLGVAEPDAPDPAWTYDSWILSFKGNKLRPVATIGMENAKEGAILLRDDRGRSWQSSLR